MWVLASIPPWPTNPSQSFRFPFSPEMKSSGQCDSLLTCRRVDVLFFLWFLTIRCPSHKCGRFEEFTLSESSLAKNFQWVYAIELFLTSVL